MDFLKSQLDRISAQLSGLTPSQKMLTAAMVAIMVMTLVWWGRYAGEPDMEPLLPQSISADELTRVEMELDAKGIKYTVAGDKLLVPADRKLEAVASLMYSHALPRNAKDGFDDVLKNINPFMSEKQTSQMWNRGKETTVSQIISQFPDVADARVLIDPMREVRIGGGIEPSATVTITMRNGVKPSQQLVDAAADVVQGAQSSLPRNKIKVVIDGMPRRLRQENLDGGLYAEEQQESIQRAEMHFEDKIKNQLSYIPGLMVSVSVSLNTTREDVHQTTYDPKNSLSKETEIQNKTSESSGPAGAGGEPGIAANTGLSVTGAPPAPTASAAPTNTTEENTTKLQNFVAGSEIHRETPAGDTKPVAAAVRVPLSYFAMIYTREHPDAKDPTEAQMRALIDVQLPKIKSDVKMCTTITDPAQIAVETYVDPTPVMAVPQTVTAGVTANLLTGNHVKDAVLGLLAVVSLFMVSSMVRKGAPPTLLIPAGSSAPSSSPPGKPAPTMLEVGADVAGEVGAGGGMLDGMELDDDMVRTQQMLEQVSSLVKENPDSAATLVKRWLNRP